MSQTLSFSEIPSNLRVPGVYSEVRPLYTNQGIVPWPAKALIIGQALSGGTTGVALPITRAAQADAYFGVGSIASAMVKAFLLANPFTPVDAFALPDATTTTKATGSFLLAGTPSVASTAYAYIGGVRIPFLVDPATATTAWATALNTAIAATAGVPATATVTGSTVTVTARHGGTLGNAIDLRMAYNPDEVVPGLTTTITAMSGGSGDPTVATAFTALARSWYTDIVMPWTDTANLTALTAELARRYNAMAQQDAHAYLAVTGSYSALTTLGATLDSQFQTVMGARGPTPSWVWAATLAGVGAFQLTNDPARQLRGLALPGVLAPSAAEQFIFTEQNNLLFSGISTFDVANDGTVVLQRVITSYIKTNLGVVDDAWLDITVPKVMTRVRYDWDAYVAETYPRSKLADDGSLAAEYADNVVTPNVMKASWAGRAKIYETVGWLENTATTSKQAVFVRNSSDRNRLDSSLPVQIIGNLMVLANSLQFEV